jgi:hypothetical protein
MEEAAVKPVRAQKKRCGDWQLAVRRHGQLKKWNQGNGGSWKKLTASCRGMIRRAIPAWNKGHGQDIVAREAPKSCMLKRKQRTHQEGSNGIRDRDVKEKLRPRKERTTRNGIRGRSRGEQLQHVSTGNVNETFRETLELEITKRIAGASI